MWDLGLMILKPFGFFNIMGLTGKKWLYETAAELVTRRLASNEKPENDPELEQDLLKYINKKNNTRLNIRRNREEDSSIPMRKKEEYLWQCK